MTKRVELETVIDDCTEQFLKYGAEQAAYIEAGELLVKLHGIELDYEKLEADKENKEKQRELEAKLKE